MYESNFKENIHFMIFTLNRNVDTRHRKSYVAIGISIGSQVLMHRRTNTNNTNYHRAQYTV